MKFKANFTKFVYEDENISLVHIGLKAYIRAYIRNEIELKAQQNFCRAVAEVTVLTAIKLLKKCPMNLCQLDTNIINSFKVYMTRYRLLDIYGSRRKSFNVIRKRYY